MSSLLKNLLKHSYYFVRDQYEHYYWSRFYNPARTNLDRDLHLREAVAWLCRAQDFGNDRGVSYGAVLGGAFEESYPETTGYIIPTFIELSDYYKDPSLLQRAVEMGDWIFLWG